MTISAFDLEMTLGQHYKKLSKYKYYKFIRSLLVCVEYEAF